MGSRAILGRDMSVAAALAASRIGVWEFDVAHNRFRFDKTAASIFGWSADDGERGISLECFLSRIDPADRARFVERRNRLVTSGEPFAVEYRVNPTPREVRWVLSRGRYERDGEGRILRGRGILVELDDSKREWLAEEESLCLTPPVEQDREGTLVRIADCLLETHRLIESSPDVRVRRLMLGVKALLADVGRELASELSTPPSEVTKH